MEGSVGRPRQTFQQARPIKLVGQDQVQRVLPGFLTCSILEDKPLVSCEGRGTGLLQPLNHAVRLAAIEKLEQANLCLGSALLGLSGLLCKTL